MTKNPAGVRALFDALRALFALMKSEVATVLDLNPPQRWPATMIDAMDRTVERIVAAARIERDAAGIAAFRFILGLLVCASGIRFLAFGWVDELWTEPSTFFTYWGFGWVKPLPAPGMHLVCAALTVFGLAFAIGAFTHVVTPLPLRSSSTSSSAT